MGARALTDEDLRELLRPLSSESCKWSHRFDCPMLQLHGNRRSIAKALQDYIAESTLCKRLQKGKLGFKVGRRRSGLCEYCQQFDLVEAPAIEQALDGIRKIATDKIPWFFNRFDDAALQDDDFQKLTFIKELSPKFLLNFCEHVEKFWQRVPVVDGLDEAEYDALEEKCLQFVDKFMAADGPMEIVANYHTHIKLKDHQEKSLADDEQTPKDDTLYLKADLGESIFFNSLRSVSLLVTQPNFSNHPANPALGEGIFGAGRPFWTCFGGPALQQYRPKIDFSLVLKPFLKQQKGGNFRRWMTKNGPEKKKNKNTKK